MKRFLVFFLLLLFGVGMYSCTSVTMVSPTISPSMQPTISSLNFEFSGKNPTLTPTLSSTSTSSNLSSTINVTTKCSEILPNVPEKGGLTGRVFFIMPPTPVKAGNVSDLEMDLKTRTLTSIIWPKNTQIGGYTVSPDGKRIAYWKILYSNEKRQIARSIIIEDANGNILKELSGDVETWKTFYWLDNQRIVIGMDGQPYVLNPFTGEGYDLSKWYAQSPGGLKTIPVWDVNGIFDSQLSRLFYIQEDDTLLLWDLKLHQILVRINPNSSFSSDDQPKWAWDDSEIVLGRASGAENQGEELFSVSRDGKINQLTELSKEYHQVAILKFNWSPNGQNIAFFFRDKSKENNVSQFAVLNRKTLKIINFCNLSGFMQPNVEPVWSPDGNKLLIGRLEADSKTYKTVLLDLSNETAAILTENRIPAGWMVAP